MGVPVSAIAVANAFLEFAELEERRLTHMELQKYTFFAHAWHLGYTGQPLVEDQIQAWKYGPVIPRMYHAFKGFGNDPIDKYGVEFDGSKCEVIISTVADAKVKAYLKKVWNAYKGFRAGVLSSMSHEPNGPWAHVYRESGSKAVKNIEIPNRLIAEFYGQRTRRCVP